MAATEIKIIVLSAEVLDDAKLLGFGAWSFACDVLRLASNEKIAVGDATKHFEVETGKEVTINHSKTLEILGDDTGLEILVEGTSNGRIWNSTVGKVKIVIKTPIVHGYDLHLTSDTKNYSMHLKIDVTKSSDNQPADLSTILQNSDSSSYNTLHDEMLSKMVHIHPVTPVPWATGIPPIAKGVIGLSASPQVDFSVKSGDPLNGLINPSFIATIDPKSSDFSKRVARIRVTQFRPADLDLSKLVWSVASGDIKFYDKNMPATKVHGGQEVKVYGVTSGNDDGRCKIEVRWDGEGAPLLATFIAIVGKPKYVWCRGNIIKSSTANALHINPSITAADVKSHVAFSNVILWQSGIEMVMDTDETAHNNAVKLEDGIFEVTHAENYTFNIDDNNSKVGPLLNARSGVFNMAYIHSLSGEANAGVLGEATDRRLSPEEGTADDSTSPSTSWVQPSGVFPDADASKVTMKTMGRSDARNNSQKTLCGDGTNETLNTISACYMTENVKTRLARGNITLPHELGHVLGLHHRGNGGGQDVTSYDDVNHTSGPRKGRGHPWNENFMCYGSDAIRQDVDLLQTQVMRANALCKDAKPGEVKPPAPPVEDKPVPVANLPTEADKILLQEYLSGVKPGLTNCGYDLGSSGPSGNGIDGIIGSKSKQAVKNFQSAHGGLVVDGIYGPNTNAAFDAELNSDS